MMKKIKVLYIVVLLLGFGCHNEPYEGDLPFELDSCIESKEATAEAYEDYSLANEDSYSLMCQIYRDAIEDQIEICGDEDGALQILLDELGNCIVEEDLCDEAIAATEIAQNNYENATDDDFEEVCSIYKEALIYQIVVCGDDGLLAQIIENLGDCEPVYVETLGIWRLVAWEPADPSHPALDIDNDGVLSDNYLDEIDCYDNETIEFYSDGTGILFYRSEASITYTPIEGTNEVEFFVTCFEIEENILFDWEQDGNLVMLTLSDGTIFNYFRNANLLYRAVDNGLYATSMIDGTSTITDPVSYIYVKI